MLYEIVLRNGTTLLSDSVEWKDDKTLGEKICCVKTAYGILEVPRDAYLFKHTIIDTEKYALDNQHAKQ
jgi:hypothetical protein